MWKEARKIGYNFRDCPRYVTKNIPIEDICELTGLTKEQIRALVK